MLFLRNAAQTLTWVKHLRGSSKGPCKRPKFKKKGKSDSFPSECFANTIDNCGKPIELNGWSHKLPFIGIVKTYEPIEATVKKITISRQAGDWYISCVRLVG
ncbi:hypothetical protein CYANOKiyG1_33420 [Okeania sp. KiyG1]|nr:hypothetical protein CYANOKiyG1_33420 [Okeania sp. KiyG1]